MNTEQQFLDQIDATDNWRPVALALADWLEERGDKRASGWRWLVEKGRDPQASDGQVFIWEAGRGTEPHNVYWPGIFRMVGTVRDTYWVLEYPSRSAALADAAQAMVKPLDQSTEQSASAARMRNLGASFGAASNALRRFADAVRSLDRRIQP